MNGASRIKEETVADNNAARLLRALQENPPGRTGPWWERNCARLLAALEAARLEVCAYPLSSTCDCKYGLIPGGHDPAVIGSEHTGCPELRQLIRTLREVSEEEPEPGPGLAGEMQRPAASAAPTAPAP